MVGIISCEPCSKLVIRILRCCRYKQRDAQDDIGVVFHGGTSPENGPAIQLLITNIESESQRSHGNSATCSSI